MGLKQTITEKNARLNEIIASHPPGFILGAPQLNDQDCILIARSIIVFNYIEINLRRMMEYFLQAGKVSTKYLKYGTYADAANLISKVLEGFENLEISKDDIDHVRLRLQDIDYCRNFRNIFAHSAARRFPDEAAVIFFMKDDKESIKRTGAPVGYENLSWIVILDEDIKSILDRVSEHEVWTAKAVTKIYFDLISGSQAERPECQSRQS